ncbi:hypothetical protein JL722_848 [Aureococcus anophagefferens]|nr:hypothetical protein JL722_848 [Aureococcus anophagefferens]
MLRASVLAAFALASAADDWDAGTNGTCPRLWSACGGDVEAWTGRLDASELLVMVVTGQATWKKRVGAMILPTWGRRVSASLVLLSDACGSDGKVPTVTLRLAGLPPGAWGAFPRQARYEASKANGYELAQLRWPVGLQFAAWLAARRPFRWALTLDDDRRGEFSEAFPQSDKLLPHCLAKDGVEFRASPNFLPLPPSFYVAYDDVGGAPLTKVARKPKALGFLRRDRPCGVPPPGPVTAHAPNCVEIDQWNAPSSENFKPL